MRFGSGSYDVRQSEGMHPGTLNRHRTITCTVFFLDGTERQFQFDRQARGQDLLDRVFGHLELVEREYFGLQFVCVLDTRDTQQKRWLEPQKSVRKQMFCPPYSLFFRVKFFVSDPVKLVEEYTRYHYFLQIRKDLLEGKLRCAEGSLALLGSYSVQSELGDYNPDEMPSGYLDNFPIAPGQSQDLVRKVAELHQVHKGQTPAEAEFNFLDHAKRLEMYGVELYEAQDVKGLLISVGVNAFGLLVFHHEKKIQEFAWSAIMKISFKRKQFFVTVRLPDANGLEDDNCITFNIHSAPACKQLWKACIEHHTFFRLIAPPAPPQKGLFNLGSRFRYSGRTEFQTIEEMRQRARVERTFRRSTSRNGGLNSRATISGGHSSASSSQYTPTHTVDSPDLSLRLFSHSWARKLLPLGGGRSASLVSDASSRHQPKEGDGFPTTRPTTSKHWALFISTSIFGRFQKLGNRCVPLEKSLHAQL
ncbi:unnamed protein product, partial [Mesorhabditis spiculigera]